MAPKKTPEAEPLMNNAEEGASVAKQLSQERRNQSNLFIYTQILFGQGKSEEALQLIDKAMELDGN